MRRSRHSAARKRKVAPPLPFKAVTFRCNECPRYSPVAMTKMGPPSATDRKHSGHRRAGAPARGPAPGARGRPLHRRCEPARPGLCGDGALAACARADPRDRRRARPWRPGRAGGAHRRRLSRRRPQADAAHAVVAASGRDHAAATPTARRSSRPPHYPLPVDKARFVGEAVAMVVAETLAAAKDGAELVEVDYEVLPAVTDTAAAAATRTRRACTTERSSNVCIDAEVGDARGDRRGLRARRACRALRDLGAARHRRADGAARRARRIRSATASATRFTPAAAARCGRRTIWPTMLGVPPDEVRVRHARCRRQFRHARHDLSRVRAGRLGGAPRRPAGQMDLRAPAKRSSATTRRATSPSRRNSRSTRDGNFLAMRGSNLGNLGAYTHDFSLVQKGVEIMSSIYRVPAAHFRARAVLSNTAPTRPYRSAGRPEVMFVMERLIDLAAREFGFDRVELRRRNLRAANRRCRTPIRSAWPTTAATITRSMERGARARPTGTGFPRAPRRGDASAANAAASASPTTSTPRPACRASAPRSPCCRTASSRSSIGTVSQRPGARDELRAAGHRMARRADRHACASSPATPTASSVGGGAHSGRGMRLGSIVMLESLRRRSSRRAQRIAEPCCWRPRPPISSSRDGRFTRQGHRPLDRPVRGRARRARAHRPAGRICAGPLAAACDETVDASRASPMAATSARSRSIRRPAWSRSSATPRSTMSAARSTR